MKYVFLLYALVLMILPGCFYFGNQKYEDITIYKNYKEWNYRECLSVMAANVSNNFNDFRTNIKISVTPYLPSVILAMQRSLQIKKNLPEYEFQFNVNELLKESSGLFIDWEKGRIVDGKGNYFKRLEQLDSMLFLVTLINSAWTSINSSMEVSYGGISRVFPLIGFDQCYIPDISNIEENIFIVNENGDSIKPAYIYGKRNNYLTTEETMFIMFHFNKKSSLNSNSFRFVVKGFESTVELKIQNLK